jgi:DNA repair exonuclease SbcCD ATPase subunit
MKFHNSQSLVRKTSAKFKAQEIQAKVKEKNKRLSFYNDNDTCHTCEQTIDVDVKEKQITKLTAEKTKLDDLKPLIVETFKALEEQQDNLSTLRKQHFDLAEKRRGLVNEKNTTQKVIENTKTSTHEIDEESLNTAREELETLLDKEKALIKNGNELYELRHYYEICKVLLKDDGIKSKIIKQYLPIMNKLINQNLDRMGANYSFNLDEGFNEVIKSRYRDNFSYASFSEGEKMRIDLSLMFTWREIAKLKNSVNTNLLLLDEIGDSSLDGDATDVLWEMIGDMRDTNVFVISHKTTNSDKFDNHFSFEKQGNFSKIVSHK